MYLNRLELDNFRCFEQTAMDFVHAEQNDCPKLGNINLILGTNGAGKTSILRAITLSVLSRYLGRLGFSAENLMRRSTDGSKTKTLAAQRATFLLHDLDTEKRRDEPQQAGFALRREGDLEYLYHDDSIKGDDPVWKNLFLNDSPAFFLVGYGASRWVPTKDAEVQFRHFGAALQRRFERAIGLFQSAGLMPLTAWLPKLFDENQARGQEALTLINDLLPTGFELLNEMEGSNYLFLDRGVKVPFPELSDGYRAYLGWVTDLVCHLSRVCPSDLELNQLKGIVLIDEIDLHLHPRWQRTVVPTIAKVLPKLQFVMTSHSPLVASSLEAGNILVLDRDERGLAMVRRSEESIKGLNANQILTGTYFGLKSTRAEDTVETLESLSEKAMSGDEAARKRYMEILVRGEHVSEATR